MRKKLVKNRSGIRKRRAQAVRSRIRKGNTRPRLSVMKSNRHLSVQIIDDEKGITLAGATTAAKELRGTDEGRVCKQGARKLGETIAQLAKEKNVTELVFDRGANKFHGVLAELADSARANGLQF